MPHCQAMHGFFSVCYRCHRLLATSSLLPQEEGPGADGAGPLALVAAGFVLLL